MDEPPSDEHLKRIDKLEHRINENRWRIVWLCAALICIMPPIFIVTALTMLDISNEIVTPQGKLTVKSHPLSEELLIKIGSGIGAATITGLALIRRTDVIKALIFSKKKDGEG